MFEPILEFSNGVNKALLMYSKTFHLIIGVIYRQPTNPQHRSDAPEFIELVTAMQSCIETIEGNTPDLYICETSTYLIPFKMTHTHQHPAATISFLMFLMTFHHF